MRVLVTGGAGFIGARFARLLLDLRPQWRIIILDALTYAASLERLGPDRTDPRLTFIEGDITDPACVRRAVEGCAAVVNFAAETHVDRSITSGIAFSRTNVVGVQVLLEEALAAGVERFLQVSTDEVYGPLPFPERSTERSPLRPRNPYAASKAGADLLVEAFHSTHGLPTLITRGSNTYGPWQFPEKAIPVWITRALRDLTLPVYGDGLQMRDWLHVDDHCRAILAVLEHGAPGEAYNVGAHMELTNLEVARMVANDADAPPGTIAHTRDRPGHDRRYALDTTRIAELGWAPTVQFKDGLRETVGWYASHREWWAVRVEPR